MFIDSNLLLIGRSAFKFHGCDFFWKLWIAVARHNFQRLKMAILFFSLWYTYGTSALWPEKHHFTVICISSGAINWYVIWKPTTSTSRGITQLSVEKQYPPHRCWFMRDPAVYDPEEDPCRQKTVIQIFKSLLGSDWIIAAYSAV